MARRRIGFKPSERQQRVLVARQLAFMAGGAPDEKREAAEAHAAAALASIPQKRKTSGVRRDLEGPVIAAISELLAAHPRVLFACRQNSGMASYEAKSGRYAPVFFYRILTHGKEITIPDFWGILKDGRLLAVEAKAPGFYVARTDRERAQANFLAMVSNAGGVALFATSAEEVAAALK